MKILLLKGMHLWKLLEKTQAWENLAEPLEAWVHMDPLPRVPAPRREGPEGAPRSLIQPEEQPPVHHQGWCWPKKAASWVKNAKILRTFKILQNTSYL